MNRRHFGFVGIGHMGAPMAARLLDAGHELTVWNRTRSKCAALESRGAHVADCPAQVAEAASVVGLSLYDGPAVELAADGENGLFSASNAGDVRIVDFSSVAPEASIALASRAAEHGMSWIDAPVTGGPGGAAAGTLVIFAGASEQQMTDVKPFMDSIGGTVHYTGKAGNGQKTKLCNQMIVGVNFIAMAETIAFARRNDLDPATLAKVLKGGMADSTLFQAFAPTMADHEFDNIRGTIGIMSKDMELVQSAALSSQAAIPMASLCTAFFRAIKATGGKQAAAQDLSTLITLFESVD